MLLIISPQSQHCLHNFFRTGDVIEFNCTELLYLAEAVGFPPSRVQSTVIKVGCSQLLINIHAYNKIILIDNCSRYVRLVQATTDLSQPEIAGCRKLEVQHKQGNL